jgi:choline dehydrogenase-like flavoprotein
MNAIGFRKRLQFAHMRRLLTIRRGTPDDIGEFDVCVVGSGPAGLAVALSLGQRGFSVIVLESGGDKTVASCIDDDFSIVNGDTHAPLHVATREGLGGTSVAWGGLCVPYDEIDFVARDWAPEAAWPLDYSEARTWSSLASHFLNCGQAFEGAPLAGLDSAVIDAEQLGRLAKRAALGIVYRELLEKSKNILVCLESKVADILVDPARARVIGVEVAGAVRQIILARRVVLAGGGLRSTGMLLALAQAHPRRFPRAHALGRYYMGHLTGEIATIVFNDPRRAASFLYACDVSGHWAQRRLKLPPGVQRAERLLNTAFTLRPPPLHDPRHADGSLSALALFAAMPGLRNRVTSGRLRRSSDSWRPHDQREHLGNIFRQPAATLRSFGKLLAGTRIENLPLMALNRSGCAITPSRRPTS